MRQVTGEQGERKERLQRQALGWTPASACRNVLWEGRGAVRG